MESIIAAGLAQLGLATQVPADAPAQLARYGQLLLEKNQVMNLTAIRQPEAVARLHMLDCAALLSVVDIESGTLIDVGSGAGFPGLALKVLCPSLDVTLLDSLGKRTVWLSEVAQQLNLEDVRAIHARAEEQALLPGFRDSFDFATARAVADLRLLCELCLPFVKVGGAFLAMKSVDSDAELRTAQGCIRRMGGQVERYMDYLIPGTQVTHRVIIIRKHTPTPKGYPRTWAKLRAHPL